MNEVDIPGGGVVHVEFPGDPDRADRLGAHMSIVGTRLRTQSRSASSAGATASRCWQGSASVAYANRNNRHVRSTAADAGTIDRAGKAARGFAKELRRIQTEGRAAVTEHGRLSRELESLLRHRSVPGAGPGRELGVEEDIGRLRTLIRAQDLILEGLAKDLIGLRKKFGDELLDLVPLDVVVAYFGLTRARISDLKTLFGQPVHAAELIAAARRHRKAVKAGDTHGAKLALQEMRRRRDKIIPPPGKPVKMADRAAKLAGSKVGLKVLGPERAARVVAVARSPVVARVALLGTPVGAVLTVIDGLHDATTGDGKEGVQGTVTRVTGTFAVIGAPLLLTRVPVLMGLGGILVASHAAWKVGMRTWDRGRAHRYKPPRTASERLSRLSPTMRRGTGAMSPGSFGQRRVVEEFAK